MSHNYDNGGSIAPTGPVRYEAVLQLWDKPSRGLGVGMISDSAHSL